MIVQIFELRCDDCKDRFEDLFDFSLVSHSDVRAEARKRGWKRLRVPGKFGDDLQDFCAQCKGKH
jgi:hypothetical protein